ncbi:hypothetical protein G9A89_006370 [Geosiphon pyriformis]|nr:hypothetical protein G9A89_006370 [Geosiphon pyriformis]
MSFSKLLADFFPFFTSTNKLSPSPSISNTINIPDESIHHQPHLQQSSPQRRPSKSSFKSAVEPHPNFPQIQNNRFGKLRKTQSSNMLLKNPIRRNWSSGSMVAQNFIITSPPNPQAKVPLWAEQVQAEIKKELDSETIKRQEVIFEIIRTEKEFVDDLTYLLDQLLNLQAIYQIVPSITEPLASLVTKIKTYDKYLFYHKTAISELSIARKKNTKLGQFINNLEAHVMTGRYRSLESLLTKPIQRLCKYPLLVMALLKTTPVKAIPQDNHHLKIDYANLGILHNKLDFAIRDLQEPKEKEDFTRRISNGLGLITPINRTKTLSRHHPRFSTFPAR